VTLSPSCPRTPISDVKPFRQKCYCQLTWAYARISLKLLNGSFEKRFHKIQFGFEVYSLVDSSNTKSVFMLFSNCSSSRLHFLLNQDLFFSTNLRPEFYFSNLKPGVVRGDFENIFHQKQLDLDLEKL
jgi:hypothetical protein